VNGAGHDRQQRDAPRPSTSLTVKRFGNAPAAARRAWGQPSDLARLQRGDALLDLADPLVEIAGGRAHHDEHAGAVAPLLAGELLDTLEALALTGLPA
jgi:hypothetical protein